MKGVQHVFDNEEETVRCIQALTNDAGADAVMLCVGGNSSGLIDKALQRIQERGTE